MTSGCYRARLNSPVTGFPGAIAATFARRDTEVPAELPDALTLAFATDAAKVQQWTAFARM